MSFEFPNNDVVASMIGDAFKGHPTKKDVKDEIDSATKNLSEKIDRKVEKVSGKGLSTNDFTNEYKEKLDNIGSGSGSPELPDLSGYATKEEVSKIKDSLTDKVSEVKDSLADKANTEDVWLRGDDVTGETNYAKSIKVNEIEALSDESGIKFNSHITTSEIIDENGTTQNLTIKNNEISARFIEDECGGGYYGTIVMNAALELPNGSIYCPNAPINASSFDGYGFYVQEGGYISIGGYDSEGNYGRYDNIDYAEFDRIFSNIWWIENTLRGHITHDKVNDEMYGEVWAVTITPTDEYGGYSDFYFTTNGSLSMSGGLSVGDVSCAGYVSCDHVLTTSGVYANSYIEESEEWGDSDFGGYSVTDSNNCSITSKLLAGKLRIEQYFYDGGHDGYYDYVEIRVRNGLSLSLSYGGEKLKFTFSDFATLRDMIDEYNASKGA